MRRSVAAFRARGAAHLHDEARDSERLAQFLDAPKVVLNLLFEPAFGRRLEGDGKAHGHFRTDASAAVQDRGKRLAAHVQADRGLGDRKSERLETQTPRTWLVSLVVLLVDKVLASRRVKKGAWIPVSTVRQS